DGMSGNGASATPPAAGVASAAPASGASAPAANQNVPPSVRPAATAEVNELSTRIQTLEKRQRWVTAALALAVLVAVGWPIVLSALALLRAPEEGPPTLPQTAPTGAQPEAAQAPKNAS